MIWLGIEFPDPQNPPTDRPPKPKDWRWVEASFDQGRIGPMWSFDRMLTDDEQLLLMNYPERWREIPGIMVSHDGGKTWQGAGTDESP